VTWHIARQAQRDDPAHVAAKVLNAGDGYPTSNFQKYTSEESSMGVGDERPNGRSMRNNRQLLTDVLLVLKHAA
jgi:hypothetical protein